MVRLVGANPLSARPNEPYCAGCTETSSLRICSSTERGSSSSRISAWPELLASPCEGTEPDMCCNPPACCPWLASCSSWLPYPLLHSTDPDETTKQKKLTNAWTKEPLFALSPNDQNLCTFDTKPHRFVPSPPVFSWPAHAGVCFPVATRMRW